MLEQCRNCKKEKELTGLSLETKLCKTCRTCYICEKIITDGIVYYTLDKSYRKVSIRCFFHYSEDDKYRRSHQYDLEKLIEEYRGEKTSYLGLQQENEELKVRIRELEERVKELEKRLENSQLTAQIEINPYQK